MIYLHIWLAGEEVYLALGALSGNWSDLSLAKRLCDDYDGISLGLYPLGTELSPDYRVRVQQLEMLELEFIFNNM